MQIVRIELNNWTIPLSIFKDIDDQGDPEVRSETDWTKCNSDAIVRNKNKRPSLLHDWQATWVIVNDVLQLFEPTWWIKFCTAISWVHCITIGRYVLVNDYYICIT